MAVYGNMVVTKQGQALYAKVQAGTQMQFTRLQIGSGQLTTQLSSALTSGTSYTSIPVQGLTSPVASGQTITIGTGSTTQTVTASAAVSIGATSIPVASFAANANYPAGTTVTLVSDPTTLTGLLSPIDWVPINSISTNGNTANILAIYQNTKLQQPTYTCEIGLFAQDPQAGEILYAYANAGAQGDTFPPYSAGPYSRQFQLAIAVGNATQVTANVPTGTWIPVSQMGVAGGVATLDASGNVPASQLGNVPPVHVATTSSPGTVQVSASPSSGNPVAVTTVDPAYTAIQSGTYLTAGTGLYVTSTTNGQRVSAYYATGSSVGVVELPSSAGSPSSPVVVYRAVSVKDMTLTSTSATTVLSYTPAATGQFKVSGYLCIANAATSVTVTLTYTSPSGSQTITLVPQYTLAVGDYTITATTLEATTSSAITLTATAGTANNVTISAVLEAV